MGLATTCCIAGGGPAGMVLGYLLARAGIEVVVLEKHADFNRDFRGDTVHPSTLEVLAELGLLEEMLQLPHDEITSIAVELAGTRVTVGDFSHLPTRCRFVALVPQWDLLNFLAARARARPTFHLMMQAEAVGLIEEAGTVAGVRIRTAAGEEQIRAALTVAADGRHSRLRQAAGLAVRDLGAPMDVLWFRLSRRDDDGTPSLGHARGGELLVTIPRTGYFQCALVIAKGSGGALQAGGIEVLRQRVAAAAPELSGRVGELMGWSDVSLLTVRVDRLHRWHKPGLLCIGDAAHAMSPIGGVGINLAIQDAVAAANFLWRPLAQGQASERDLARVQRRRHFPTVATQAIQTLLQRQVVGRVLEGSTPTGGLPLALRVLRRLPWLERLPARVLGMGVRPEHVRSPARAPGPIDIR